MVTFTVIRLVAEHGARMRISVFVYQVADLAPIDWLVEYTPWLNTLQQWSLRAMKLREVLATNLKHFRLAAGLSQEELAHRAHLDRTYVSSLRARAL